MALLQVTILYHEDKGFGMYELQKNSQGVAFAAGEGASPAVFEIREICSAQFIKGNPENDSLLELQAAVHHITCALCEGITLMR